MKEEGLDFDDSLVAYVVKKLNLKVVISYDFDGVDWLERKVPEDLVP